MLNVAWFDQIDRKDIDLVGGKGANLGELFQAGIPVPFGFIVTSEAYFRFLEKNKINRQIKKILKNLNSEDGKKLNFASKEIQIRILKNQFPQDLKREIELAYQKLCDRAKLNEKECLVAVRSSATAEDLPNASFAGQQATFLNVSGASDLIRATQKCWASLFEPRAIYYRAINNFDHFKVGIAVPVQLMIESEKSGVLFTINPLNNNENEIVIEAGWGLGEAIVSGSITPDKYVVDKKSFKIISKDINKQTWEVNLGNNHHSVVKEKQAEQKISDKEIIELAKIGKKIEDHYSFAQDTEWAIDGKGAIWFVQARPVTTMKMPHATDDNGDKIQAESKKILVKGIAASIGTSSGIVKIIHGPLEIDKIKSGDILVAEMTNPSYVPAMRRASGIVTDAGGLTSHAAIVSRELGIPCIVGTGTATTLLKNGTMVTVDGRQGFVYLGKAETIVPQKQSIASSVASIRLEPAEIITGTKIYVNLAEPDLAQEVSKFPVDGVGLLRAEFMISELGEHPKSLIARGKKEEYVKKLTEGIGTIAKAFYPRPVVYRATDFKTNEYRDLKGGDKYEKIEANPMIGYRGCFRYIKDPELFKLELEAIKKNQERNGLNNIWLMIPFVRTPEEFSKIKDIIDETGLKQDNKFKIWIMAEVPSVALLIEEFCQLGINGVSIGSNDLTQLVLGIDRDNALLADEFDERHPAVEKAISEIISITKKHNISSSICGNAPSVYPEVVEYLIKAGITSISVAPDQIIPARKLVASIEKKILLEKAMD